MDKLLIQRRALKIREQYRVDLNSPIDLFSLVNTDPEITLILYPFNDEISGICIKSASLIAVNSRSTLGRQSFSIAHELYHYFFDGEKTFVSYFGDNFNTGKTEKEANLFASYLLMPDSGFSSLCQRLTGNELHKIDLFGILEIEQYYRISRNAVLIRLVTDGYLTLDETEQYKTDILRNAKKLGYEVSLYLPSKIEEPKTYGAYIKKALELKDSRLISDGKYEEYMLDAHRSDIVFDDNGEEDIYD